MKKLSNKTFFSIVQISEGVFIIVGAHGFVVYNCIEDIVLFRSPFIKNISTVLCNETQNALLAVDTYGKIIIFKETEIKSKLKIKKDPRNCDLFSENNNFYCIDAKNNLVLLNDFGEKLSTISFMESIDALYKIDNTVYINVLTHNSKKDSLDVTSEIYECQFNGTHFYSFKTAYKENGFVDKMKLDFNGKNISILFDKANGKGRINEIVIFSQNNSQTHMVLEMLDIQKKINNYEFLVNYATNIDQNLLALLWYDEFVVWDYINQEIICREKVENGTDVVWISANKLLITSWLGLFYVEI